MRLWPFSVLRGDPASPTDGSSGDPEERRVSNLRFLREQDGESERELKSALADLFSRRGRDIERAYLAQMRAEGEVVVALCLKTHSGVDEGLVRELGRVFSPMFNAATHLDILFLSDEQEREIVEVCQPFFAAGAAHPATRDPCELMSALASGLEHLRSIQVPSQGDLARWYEAARLVGSQITTNLASEVPSTLWHYLFDADIRFKSKEYAERQDREIRLLIRYLKRGEMPTDEELREYS